MKARMVRKKRKARKVHKKRKTRKTPSRKSHEYVWHVGT